jgi:3',5'-cyclic-AMP phosphodiesterase
MMSPRNFRPERSASMSERITRREAMKVVGAAAALGGLSFPIRALGQAQPISRKRAIRVAHLTDVHVQPQRKADQGMIACLHHVQGHKDTPELMLAGGDSIMDSFESDDARTTVQWDIWGKTLKDECSLPVKSAIGNHDIWGWSKSRSKTTGDEPNYGKKRATEMLRLEERYYSFDRAGWHFIVLDSTQSDGAEGYRAFLDDEQYDWLCRDLQATNSKTPVLVLSHIPIMSASAILWSKKDSRGDFTISGSLVHQDGIKIKDLFARHNNVKLCLSGHLHHVDRVDYNGVTYLCNGAVSGNWWKGRHKDCDEGYAIIDLFEDGSFEHEYVKYGWKAQA